MGNYLSAAPKREQVFKSLSTLYDNAIKPGVNTCISLEADAANDKFIIFSDQHKGNKTWLMTLLPLRKAMLEPLLITTKKDLISSTSAIVRNFGNLKPLIFFLQTRRR